MDNVYRSIKNPGSLSGIERLYKSVKKNDPSVRRNDVETYLRGKRSYTLHKVTKKKFPRRQYLSPFPGHTISCDIAYFQEYKSSNNGIGYLLICIDIFSRYLTVFPLKTLKAVHVSSALETFFKNTVHRYKKIFTDEGQEFLSKQAFRIYDKYNIHWYTTYNKEIKASLCERVIQTLKKKLSKYITEFNNEHYLDVLDTLVETYNHTPHRGLMGRKPVDIHLIHDPKKAMSFAQRLYKSHARKITSVARNLSCGQSVRLKSVAASQNRFHKHFFIQNTEEIFTIETVNKDHVPVTYSIKDLDGNIIKGNFYRDELIPIINNELYDVQILKKRRRNKKLEYLVRYVNYPNSENQWIAAKQLEKLK